MTCFYVAFDWLLQEFIKVKKYPNTTNVETVNDGAESALFKQLFQRWTVKDQTQGLGKAHMKGKVGKCNKQERGSTFVFEEQLLWLLIRDLMFHDHICCSQHHTGEI